MPRLRRRRRRRSFSVFVPFLLIHSKIVLLLYKFPITVTRTGSSRPFHGSAGFAGPFRIHGEIINRRRPRTNNGFFLRFCRCWLGTLPTTSLCRVFDEIKTYSPHTAARAYKRVWAVYWVSKVHYTRNTHTMFISCVCVCVCIFHPSNTGGNPRTANKTDSHIKDRPFVKLTAVRPDRAKLPVHITYVCHYLLSSAVRFVRYLLKVGFDHSTI